MLDFPYLMISDFQFYFLNAYLCIYKYLKTLVKKKKNFLFI